MGKKSKKCSSNKNRRMLWFAFNAVALASRGMTALTLILISIKIHPLKVQSMYFKTCVEEIKERGNSISGSVEYCNGSDS